jgi:hypothetical protein
VTILVPFVFKICATLIGSSHSEQHHQNGVAGGDQSLRMESLVYKIPNVNGRDEKIDR